MDLRSGGGEDADHALPDLGPLVLVPGVVEERDLDRTLALRQLREPLGERPRRHLRQRPARVDARKPGRAAGEARAGDGVVQAGHPGGDGELTPDVAGGLLAEAEAVLLAHLVEDLGLHARDVYLGRALALARLARDAEVVDGLHPLAGQLLRRERLVEDGTQGVRPGPRRVLLV